MDEKAGGSSCWFPDEVVRWANKFVGIFINSFIDLVAEAHRLLLVELSVQSMEHVC